MANTFYHSDCLFVLNHDVSAEAVDLIYLDPPFFTGKIQAGKWKGEWHPEAMEVSFEDSKRFWKEKGISELAPEWMKHIAVKRPDFASYLYYMMERLQACHKVLKKTGSIYLHCDYRASHYLKMVMDEIFGYGNLQNEIIWKYSQGGKPKKRWARKHDTILFYSRTSDFYFDSSHVRIPYTPHKQSLTGSYGGRMGVDENGRPYVEKWGTGKKKLYRYYLDEGKIPEDVWGIQSIQAGASERSGYPTQKPRELLERIIKASSKEGDLILDPFCGCGTTVIVAHKLNRRWIGIDIDTSDRKKGELPTAFSVIKNLSGELFGQSRYVSRDLEEVQEMSPGDFERWVNEFYKADKPHPDKGVDGITMNGIPIQVKTFRIGYNVLSQFITDAKYHPNTSKPIKKVIVVSQTGFDDGARQRKFEIETTEGIEVCLTTPEDMLKLETVY